MAGPLTYPPEILIESTVELPPEFGEEGINEVGVELMGLVIEFAIEFVIALPFSL
jgi:hypothetical protein